VAAADTALAAVGRSLPTARQDWLRRLTGAEGPIEALRQAAEAADLPAPVAAGFVAVCHRRARWHRRLSGAQGEVEVPPAPWAAAQVTLREASTGQEQEAAWLGAWLWAELDRALET
jgi:hypothetical protein